MKHKEEEGTTELELPQQATEMKSELHSRPSGFRCLDSLCLVLFLVQTLACRHIYSGSRDTLIGRLLVIFPCPIARNGLERSLTIANYAEVSRSDSTTCSLFDRQAQSESQEIPCLMLEKDKACKEDPFWRYGCRGKPREDTPQGKGPPPKRR